LPWTNDAEIVQKRNTGRELRAEGFPTRPSRSTCHPERSVPMPFSAEIVPYRFPRRDARKGSRVAGEASPGDPSKDPSSRQPNEQDVNKARSDHFNFRPSHRPASEELKAKSKPARPDPVGAR
jgi:hypothetical protein